MIIDVNQSLKSRNNEQLMDEKKEPLTLGKALIFAIDQGLADSRDGSLKYKMGKIAHQIYQGGEIKLTTDEVSQLKDFVGKILPPHAVLEVWNALEKDTPNE